MNEIKKNRFYQSILKAVQNIVNVLKLGERDACGTRVRDKNKNIEPENQTKEYIMEIHAYLSNVFKPSSKNEMKESLKFTL